MPWHNWIELCAEIAGFVGGALLAAPYFIGTRKMQWRNRFESVQFSDPDAAAALQDTLKAIARRQFLQGRNDFVLSATGFVLVALSFLAKVVIWFARNPV